MLNSKKCKLAILYILLSIILILPILTMKIEITTSDIYFHFLRINSLAEELKVGNFRPAIYSNSLDNYGYANGIFYPDIFIYFPAILKALNVPLIIVYLIMVFVITFVSLCICYKTSKNIIHNLFSDERIISNSDKIAIVNSILYTLSLYKIYNLYYRGDIAEVIAMGIIPICFDGLIEIFYTNKKKSWIKLTIGMTMLGYSHLVSLYIMTIICLIFFLFNIRKIKKTFIQLLKACVASVMMVSCYIFPILEQVLNDKFWFQTRPFTKCFRNSIGSEYFAKYLLNDNCNLTIFIINIIIIVCFIYILNHLKSENKDKKTLVKCIVTVLYMVVITTPLFPWAILEKVPTISMIQFPWRLFTYIEYIALFLISIFIFIGIRNKRTIRYVVAFLISVPIIYDSCSFVFMAKENHSVDFYDKILTTDFIRESKDVNYTYCYVGQGEYLPSNFNLNHYETKENAIYEVHSKNEIDAKIPNSLFVKDEKIYINNDFQNYNQYKDYEYIARNDYNITKKNNHYEIELNDKNIEKILDDNNDTIQLELPVIYYKGYKASIVNEEYVDNNIQLDGSPSGLVSLYINKNITTKDNIKIVLQYKHTNVQIISYTVSLLTLLAFAIYIRKSCVGKQEC